MALVLEVILSIIFSGSMFKSLPQSTKIGVALAKVTAKAEAIIVNSGTITSSPSPIFNSSTANCKAVEALKIGEGDEVIVPEFTMIASAFAVTFAKATPIFVDCGRDLNIDPEKIIDKITSKTKAIMPVHVYGRPADMRTINRIA